MRTGRHRVVYRFGDFQLDSGRTELRHQGRRVHLARQPMDSLSGPGRAGWSVGLARGNCHPPLGRDVFGDPDAGIHTAILKVRKALGETKRSTVFVETVAGKGYRFVAPIEASQPPVSQQTAAAALPDLPLPRRHNLPADLTSFVGRQSELEALPQLLAAARLLTLTGSGGVGKTRLARRVAAAVVGQFTDGVWMADFGSLSDPDLLAETVATVLGLRESPHRSARVALIEYLRERKLLLFLDTCEHVVGACAELVELLLCEAPQLRIMATSREALAVPGEVVYRVPSLALPDPSAGTGSDLDSEAVRLFVERALATDPTFDANRLRRDGHRPDLPSCRRDPTGDRACGGKDGGALAAADRGPTGAPLSSSSRAAPAMRFHASGLWRPRWTGAISCSRRTNASS